MSKAHDISAIAHLAAKVLAEEVRNIFFIVDNQNADAHPRPPKALFAIGVASAL
jgi:hypothetical protein